MDAPTMHVAHAEVETNSRQPQALTAGFYRFYNFRVLDSTGRQVGVVDWIWADSSTGEGAFVGIRQNWLLGTARVIPTRGALIDPQARTLRLAYAAEQIKNARRCAISRALPTEQEQLARAHFSGERAIAHAAPAAYGALRKVS